MQKGIEVSSSTKENIEEEKKERSGTENNQIEGGLRRDEIDEG